MVAGHSNSKESTARYLGQFGLFATAKNAHPALEIIQSPTTHNPDNAELFNFVKDALEQAHIPMKAKP